MQVPATVQAGDTLLLFLTTGTISGTLGSPAGWTLVQTKDGATTRGRAWTKKATASDANANVTVASSALGKSAMSVSAYRSSAGTSADHGLSQHRRDHLHARRTPHRTSPWPRPGPGW